VKNNVTGYASLYKTGNISGADGGSPDCTIY